MDILGLILSKNLKNDLVRPELISFVLFVCMGKKNKCYLFLEKFSLVTPRLGVCGDPWSLVLSVPKLMGYFALRKVKENSIFLLLC